MHSWLILGLLTLVNLFNYLDRYILAALAPAIQKDLSLTDTQIGFLGTAFMFSYFLISPLFGRLGDLGARFRWMGLGVALWSVATALTAWAGNFKSLLGARACVGIGEAAYGSISPAVIGDLFPKEKRGKAFAIFFMAIPVGSALGYLLGGILEGLFGWRQAFLFAGAPGILLALFLVMIPEIPRGKFDEGNASESPPNAILKIYKYLWFNGSYFYTVLGYAAYTFVVGGVAFWMPAYLTRNFDLPLSKANMLFGGVTVVAGFLGTIVGGYWLDRLAVKVSDACLKLSAASAIIAAFVFVGILFSTNLNIVLGLCFVLEFLLFLSTSPINAEIVNCVPVAYRATANALSIFVIHLLGDAISPSLMGIISDASSLNCAMWVGPLGILLAGILWFCKIVFAWEASPWKQSWRVPKLQCHRGYHLGGKTENTLDAFHEAKRLGASMIELDVRLSKDNIAVVIHDPDILRTSGKSGLVKEMTAEQLKQIANVPTLSSVLADREIPNYVNIEIKSKEIWDGQLELAVSKAIRENSAQARVIVSSFNPLALRRMFKIAPEIPRALLVTLQDEPENKIYLKRMWLAFLARPHFLNCDEKMYTPEFAKEMIARKIRVAVWTVKDAARAKKCLDLGAESIISDNPKVVEV